MAKKLVLLFLCLDFMVLLSIYVPQFNRYLYPNGSNAADALQAGPTTVQLSHRSFTVFVYPAKQNPPLALILFGSGDGGWSGWEDKVSLALQAAGYTVMGIDSSDYAKTDYDLATLQVDWDIIAKKGRDASPGSPPPLIVGGWSMGGAQAVAVAGGPHRPEGLVGLLALSTESRGRYGLRLSDRVDIVPTGPGTFGTVDFTSSLNGLRVLQWHGAGDPHDSTAWLAKLQAPHRECDFPQEGHDFGGPRPEFVRQLVESVPWLLSPTF